MACSNAPQSGPDATTSTAKGKVRILLQTRTHLLPGDSREDRLSFMRNTVCRHVFNRDFDRAQDRWFPYRDHFGLHDCECFFLIDHHGYDHATVQAGDEEEKKIPVLWYRWTGESLIRVEEALPSKIQRELRKWPFTWEGRTFHKVPKEPDGKYKPKYRRQIIRSYLRLGIAIGEDDVRFLKEHPEHLDWLRTHLDPQLAPQLELLLSV